MSEMVERVARAIAEAHYARKYHPQACGPQARVAWLVDRYWPNWTDDAQAAIAAMREPTEGMLDGSWHQTGESKEMRARTHHHYRRHYQAMIDAALSETPTTDREVG